MLTSLSDQMFNEYSPDSNTGFLGWRLMGNSTVRHSGILINSFGEEFAQFYLISMYSTLFIKITPT